MALQVTGSAQGLVASTAQKSGSPSAISVGWSNEQISSELLARFSNLVQAGVVFSLNFPAAAFAAPSATALGAFALFNPPNSGKNIHILDVQVAVTTWTLVTTTAVAIGMIFIPNQAPTSTTSTGAVPASNLVGSGTPTVAKPYITGTTVGAPVLANRIVADFLLATAAGAGDLWAVDHVDGAVVIAPGSGIQIQGVSGTEADVTGIVGITWAELPA
jgi:hypothetical protein